MSSEQVERLCDGHDLLIDSEIVGENELGPTHSIFVECLDCDLILRDDEILEVLDSRNASMAFRLGQLAARTTKLEQALEASQQENERLCGIPEMADQHAETWEYEPVSVWLAGLQEEVAELTLAIEGEHEGPVEHELRQIGSIALNWLRKRARNGE